MQKILEVINALISIWIKVPAELEVWYFVSVTAAHAHTG